MVSLAARTLVQPELAEGSGKPANSSFSADNGSSSIFPLSSVHPLFPQMWGVMRWSQF